MHCEIGIIERLRRLISRCGGFTNGVLGQFFSENYFLSCDGANGKRSTPEDNLSFHSSISARLRQVTHQEREIEGTRRRSFQYVARQPFVGGR
jgi:hypothetical protein